MAQIQTIRVQIQTGSSSGAGTDGNVFVGVCGREFRLDTSHDDFEAGSSREYVLGAGSNVNNASVNDPRNQQLLVENVDRFPVYVRFQPQTGGDNWQLQRAEVRFNDQLFPVWDTASFIANNPTKGIWLGIRSGLVVFLVANLG